MCTFYSELDKGMYSVKSIYLSFACVFIMWGCSSSSVKESSLTVQEFDKTIELNVPASKIKMTIPRLGLIKQEDNPTNSYRYFYYWDTNEQLGISGWFEPASLFKGVQFHWTEFLSKWNGNELTDVSFEKINGWDVVRYNIDVNGCSQSNAKAFLVQNETWLDIHISAFCKGNSVRGDADIVGFIKSISVENRL